MKKFKMLMFRFIICLIVIFCCFVALMLNPQVLYANATHYRQVTIYSQKKLDQTIYKVLDHALLLAQQSELYDRNFSLDVFLNDGSSFVKIVKFIYGDAYGWGYHNNVILNGSIDTALNFIHLNGYKRQLSRTISHELIHCFQYNKYGLFGSRPLKDVPIWKWEGYPEYISNKSALKNERTLLIENIKRLMEYELENSLEWVEIEVDEGKSYLGNNFRNWLMVKYLIDIKGIRLNELMKDKIKYNAVYTEMVRWYEDEIND